MVRVQTSLPSEGGFWTSNIGNSSGIRIGTMIIMIFPAPLFRLKDVLFQNKFSSRKSQRPETKKSKQHYFQIISARMTFPLPIRKGNLR